MALPSEDYEMLLKFICVGDSGVGKSCILLQFTDSRFSATHDLTIGVEFGTRSMDVDGRATRLQVWDTAGQEAFRSITRAYYRAATACLVVFDVTSRSSFDSVATWLDDVDKFSNSSPTIVLVGNKIDLGPKRQVGAEEAAEFAAAHGIEYVETSARTGEGVEDAFLLAARHVYTKLEAGAFDPTDGETKQRALAAHGIKIGRLSSLFQPDARGGGDGGGSSCAC